MFPDQGLTKRDLAVYFRDVADWLLPFVKGRPLSTVRCPEGRDSECFFQKHTRETFDEHIDPIPVDESGETRSYIGVSSVEGLVTLAQFGVLEIHPWGSKKDKLDAPDSITFDLDPGEGVGFEAVKAGARLLRDRLDHLGLQSFLKTSGGKGLHVLIPIRRTVGWDEAKAFARDVAKQLARDEPKRFVATMSKQRRKGKVFIDYLRNARGSTSVAAYSPRARPGAPVSTPLRWDELSALDSSAAYTVRTIPRRLRSLNDDPWADYASSRQSLTRDRRDAVRG
jgi:bifunctional non-homologous end joining protein LigD